MRTYFYTGKSLPVRFTLPFCRGRGMPRPYRVAILYVAIAARPPSSVTCGDSFPQGGSLSGAEKNYRRSRKTGAGGRGVKKMCLDDFLDPPVRDPHIRGSKGRAAPGRGSAASKQRQFSLVLSFAAKRENIIRANVNPAWIGHARGCAASCGAFLFWRGTSAGRRGKRRRSAGSCGTRRPH